MSEFRQDRLRKHWVIVAEERADRPNALELTDRRKLPSLDVCPFCAGNEDETPPAAALFPAPPADWQVRVTPNKYPAVRCESESSQGAESSQETGANGASANGALFASQTGRGRHEVIIESREHIDRATELTSEQVRLVWAAYQDRLNAVQAETKLPYARVFQNCGSAAGASIEHLHSQMLAVPLLPNESAAEVDRLRDWHVEHGGCGLTQMVDDERAEGDRVVLERDGLVAFCPYASRVPYEVWVAPQQQQPSFNQAPRETAELAGEMVTELISRMDHSLHLPDYNYLIQSAPFDRSAEAFYHWRIELFPRLTIAAGFEMSSGCFINPVSPESAAKLLRKAPSNNA